MKALQTMTPRGIIETHGYRLTGKVSVTHSRLDLTTVNGRMHKWMMDLA